MKVIFCFQCQCIIVPFIYVKYLAIGYIQYNFIMTYYNNVTIIMTDNHNAIGHNYWSFIISMEWWHIQLVINLQRPTGRAIKLYFNLKMSFMLRLGKFLNAAGISAGFSLLFFGEVKDVYLAIPDNVLDYKSRMDILIHYGMIAYHFTCCNELQLNKENVHNIFNAFIAELTPLSRKK